MGIIGIEADGRLDEESGKEVEVLFVKNFIPILYAKRLGEGVVMDGEVGRLG